MQVIIKNILYILCTTLFVKIGFEELSSYQINKLHYIVGNIIIGAVLICRQDFPILLVTPLIVSQCLIDMKEKELSDRNTFYLFLIGILHMINNQAYGNIKTFGMLLLLYIVLFLIPFSSIGFGDVKLIAALSLYIPYKLSMCFVFYPFLVGLGLGLFYKYKYKESEFPFGPAIMMVWLLLL